jgi:hypothetical protein
VLAWRLFTIACILWALPKSPTVVGPDDRPLWPSQSDNLAGNVALHMSNIHSSVLVLLVPEVEVVGLTVCDPGLFC